MSADERGTALKVAWHAGGASVDANGHDSTVHVGVVESVQDPVRMGRVELGAADAEAMGHALIAAASVARGTATRARAFDCAVCLDEDLGLTVGPDGELMERVCGACTPLPGEDGAPT